MTAPARTLCERADAVRDVVYGRVPAPPVRPPRPPPPERGGLLRRGEPCPGAIPWHRQPVRAARSLAEVLTSPLVPLDVLEARNGACASCQYVSVLKRQTDDDDPDLLCGCCGCPNHRLASLNRVKNARAAHYCPAPHPLFGPWTPPTG